jgi:hypothetical protein
MAFKNSFRGRLQKQAEQLLMQKTSYPAAKIRRWKSESPARPGLRVARQPSFGFTISSFGFWLVLVVSSLAIMLCTGCLTAGPPLPAVNLKEPGWIVREGQAIWRRKDGEPGVAGEMLVATAPGGRAFVEFSKPPFPIVTAQTTSSQWEAQFPAQSRRYSGHGAPPKRLIWLYLPRVLLGEQPPANWSWHKDENGWRLENGTTGESVEGFFSSEANG